MKPPAWLIIIFILYCANLAAAPFVDGTSRSDCASILRSPAENAAAIIEALTPKLSGEVTVEVSRFPPERPHLTSETLKLVDRGNQLAELIYEVRPNAPELLKISWIKVSESVRRQGIYTYLLAHAIARHPRTQRIEQHIDAEQLTMLESTRQLLRSQRPELDENQLLVEATRQTPSYKNCLALGFGKLLSIHDRGLVFLKMGRGAE